MASPALRLVTGAAEPSTVMLGIATAVVRVAERLFDEASAELVLAPEGGPQRDAAQARFDVAADRLDAALNRRDRVIAELGGEPWLWVPPLQGADGF